MLLFVERVIIQMHIYFSPPYVQGWSQIGGRFARGGGVGCPGATPPSLALKWVGPLRAESKKKIMGLGK